MQNSLKKQSGFGLIEVIVSVTIMITIIIALNYLAQAAFRTWETAQSKTVAYNLIQGTIEGLHNKRDTNIANGQDWVTTTDLDSFKSEYPSDGKKQTVFNKEFTTFLTVTDMNVAINGNTRTDLKKKFTVTVKWKDRLKEAEMTGETYLTDWKSKY